MVLVVGELAANAVCHAHSTFRISLQRQDDVVVVGVTDASAMLPRARTASSTAIGGRGLLIVERLARTWGSRPEPGGGKTVWAEVTTS